VVPVKHKMLKNLSIATFGKGQFTISQLLKALFKVNDKLVKVNKK
jgi:hypothetical protein